MGPTGGRRAGPEMLMSQTPSGQVTQLLDAAGAGDAAAADALLPLVYEELRRVAAVHLSREAVGQTLQPTALVHEAYLRLLGGEPVKWQGRGHFFAAAARAMRRILVDRARSKQAEIHGGGRSKFRIDDEALTISEPTPEPSAPGVDLLALNEALASLEQKDPRHAEVVMLRYFAGLSIEQTALALSVSTGTVKNDWVYARAWLRREMERRGGSGTRP